MAAIFKVPTSAGAVVRAEHLFTLRLRPEARTGWLTCHWTHDGDGRLVLGWEAGPEPHEVAKPRAASSAA